ncbi:hypothetical protein NMG60_11004738 [Bertholletia excelsa]
MTSPLLFLSVHLFLALLPFPPAAADPDNLQDTCPAAIPPRGIFINGLPCKNPATVTAGDFKSSRLGRKGDTDNFYRSATAVIPAGAFPGLNTLGLAVARTDLEVDGIVQPHSHPRASEILFVVRGVVIAGFIDTQNQPFQSPVLKEGDVFVFPRGLLHFCFNVGFESAVLYSVLNSQNPGLVSIAEPLFSEDEEIVGRLKRRLMEISGPGVKRVGNGTLFGFKL